MKNQWSRKIFLKTKKKMLWARVKRLGTLLSLPLLRRLVFLRRRERETRVTREWLVTKRKGAEERREAKSRPFSPSRPTSFPGFRPTRIYGARGGQVRENPGNEVASHFLSLPFLSPEPPVPLAGEAWGSLSTRAWGSPRPRAQTSPTKRTGGSGDKNDFHRESDDWIQGSFFLLQGVAVRDLIMGTSRSWNDGEGNENVKKASGLCHATCYRFNQLKLVSASIKCQK